jgi:GT2 family glycosyltransferase
MRDADGAMATEERLVGRRIAVVIVSYRTAALVLAALPGVLEALSACARFKVVVVDNASPDGDGARLAEGLAAAGWGAEVDLIRSPRNGGFAAGNNLGLAALRALDWTPEAVLMLNPDAGLLPGALARMLAVMDAQPRAGVVGARLRNPDGSTWSGAFRFPSAFGEFAAATGLGPISRLRPVLLEPTEPARVDWVSGAAMLWRWEALVETGDMDEGYFLYYEEIDHMRAAARLGWQAWTAPAALVAHEAGAATGMLDGRPRSGPMPDYWFTSWRRYFVKNHGPGYARLAATARMLGMTIGVAQRRLRGLSDPIPPGFPRAFLFYVLLARSKPVVAQSEQSGADARRKGAR